MGVLVSLECSRSDDSECEFVFVVFGELPKAVVYYTSLGSDMSRSHLTRRLLSSKPKAGAFTDALSLSPLTTTS